MNTNQGNIFDYESGLQGSSDFSAFNFPINHGSMDYGYGNHIGSFKNQNKQLTLADNAAMIDIVDPHPDVLTVSINIGVYSIVRDVASKVIHKDDDTDGNGKAASKFDMFRLDKMYEVELEKKAFMSYKNFRAAIVNATNSSHLRSQFFRICRKEYIESRQAGNTPGFLAVNAGVQADCINWIITRGHTKALLKYSFHNPLKLAVIRYTKAQSSTLEDLHQIEKEYLEAAFKCRRQARKHDPIRPLRGTWFVNNCPDEALATIPRVDRFKHPDEGQKDVISAISALCNKDFPDHQAHMIRTIPLPSGIVKHIIRFIIAIEADLDSEKNTNPTSQQVLQCIQRNPYYERLFRNFLTNQ